MILFPHCKINLGLHILRRRADGYHDIETLFWPVRGLCDAVEVLQAEEAAFSSSGLAVDCPPEKNLCLKAFRTIQQAYPDRVKGVKIHLHKTIPFGAGLGGGSADATAVLKAVNEVYELGLDSEQLGLLAARLGSDTVFFLYDRPMLGTGRGEVLTSFGGVGLAGWWLLLVKPDAGVSTAEAYSLVTPCADRTPLSEALLLPVEQWRGRLVNDFEEPILERLPGLKAIREELYRRGAVYAALSGSGSTLFGLFRGEPDTAGFGCFTHKERL